MPSTTHVESMMKVVNQCTHKHIIYILCIYDIKYKILNINCHAEFMWCYVRNECCDNNKNNNNNNNTNHNHKYNNTD